MVQGLFGLLENIQDFCGKKLPMNLLSYQDQGLREFPEEIRQHPEVTNINLNDNEIERIPDWITELKELKVLYLNNNQITNIEKLCELPKLEVLQLNENQIRYIPETIHNLSCLKRLYLNNNLLVDIPSTLGELPLLNQLLLCYNQLTALPASVGELKSLTTLNVFHNRLDKLPDSLGKLSKLSYLQLGFNHLTYLPNSIEHLQSLNQLAAFSNELKTIPPIENLGDLQELNIGDNFIKRIENIPVQLKVLEIYHNPIDFIDPRIIDYFKHKKINSFEYLFVDTQQSQAFDLEQQIPKQTLKIVDLINKKISVSHINYLPLELRQKWQLKEIWDHKA